MTASAGKTKLEVLFFSQRFPYPLDTGGKIRTAKILEQLKNVFDITLVSNMESAQDNQYLEQVRNLCAEFRPVPWKEARKYTFRFYVKLFRAMFSRYPFTVINDYSRDLESVLCHLTISKPIDLLICDFLQPSLNVRLLKGIPMLLFEHNIESVIPRRHFETARNAFARLFWWLQWRKMERYEKEACKLFTGVVVVSEKDKEILIDQFDARNVHAIPTGVDTKFFAPQEEKIKPNSIIFTGSMDWLPNEDAILFFVRDILRTVKQQIKEVTFTIVGRRPSRYLLKRLNSYPEVTVTGWVDDIRPYISSHMVYVIPLRIGGGTRIKAYEAMAMGKAVVSTKVGVEGLPVRHGEQLVIADEPRQFAAAVVGLLRNVDERKRLEVNARIFVESNFSWEKVAEVFERTCRNVVEAAAIAPRQTY